MNQEYKIKMSKENITKIYNEEYIKGVSALELEKKYNLTKGYLYRWFNKLELPLRSNSINSKKYSFNEDYFDTIDSQDKAYWIGFIYADGFITSKRKQSNRSLGISLAIKDKYHLHKLNNCLKSNTPVNEYMETSGYAKGSTYCRVIYVSKKLTDDLINNGVYENKTNIITYPSLIPQEYIKDFIRGYFDGDGSIWKQNKNTQVNVGFVGTNEILEFIMKYLLDNNAILRSYPLNKRKEGQVVSNFKFGGNRNSFRFLDFIYGNATIYLDRKYELYLELKQFINSHPIQ